ncbi:MAG: BrnT family toxin [Elusimicrobiota bacterium]
MRVAELRCDDRAEEHIWERHRLTFREVEEAFYHHGWGIRGREKGIYEIYGRTEAGRYLMIAARSLAKGVFQLITARDMSHAERRRYGKHTAH